MTSFYMTSSHVDLNEAAKSVDIIPLTLLASLTHLHTFVKNTKWRMETIFGLAYEDLSTNLRKLMALKLGKYFTIGGCSAVGKVAF